MKQPNILSIRTPARISALTRMTPRAELRPPCLGGVQFHPEYNTDIMRSYIVEQAEELTSAGLDVRGLLDAVAGTACAAQMLRNFARIVDRGPEIV